MVKRPAPNVVVVIESEDSAVLRAGRALAKRLGLELAMDREASAAPQSTFVLALNDERLELRESAARPGHGLCVDFSSLHPAQAAKRGGFSRKQPLARAIGKGARTVLDATAGLGHDSALLACMGYRVLAVERTPIVAELLRDGLHRAEMNDELRKAFGGRLIVVNADARDVLRKSPESEAISSFDVCYIDPMFPPKRKASALAKKSIRMVREIVGEDDDAAELLELARATAKRVVVKRPTYAPPLAPKPTMSIIGNLVRYDVYVS